MLDVACGAGRHARAFDAAGARCTGVDLSVTLLRLAQQVTAAPLVRADMRQLPIRPGSMDLTVNLFTSFGYFEQDAEHTAALREMISTVRPGGWFVIDFLNPAAVRRQLVPEETCRARGSTVRVSRSVSPDGRYVCKSIRAPGGDISGAGSPVRARQMAAMLESAGVTVRFRFGDYDASARSPRARPRTILGTGRMTLRIVPTPLAPRIELPAPRERGPSTRRWRTRCPISRPGTAALARLQ